MHNRQSKGGDTDGDQHDQTQGDLGRAQARSEAGPAQAAQGILGRARAQRSLDLHAQRPTASQGVRGIGRRDSAEEGPPGNAREGEGRRSHLDQGHGLIRWGASFTRRPPPLWRLTWTT